MKEKLRIKCVNQFGAFTFNKFLQINY